MCDCVCVWERERERRGEERERASLNYSNCFHLLQHPFIAGYDDKKDILNLIMESKAEVVETVEDLPEEQEIIEMKVCFCM